MIGSVRNPNVAALPKSYFFTKIEEYRSQAGEGVISLGVGDTTQPIPTPVLEGIKEQLERLSSVETFSGYGSPEGDPQLRKRIAEVLFSEKVDPSEVFISDGAKADTSRLAWLFSDHAVVGIQDPVYPQYVDVTSLSGRRLKLLSCLEKNGFMPDLSELSEIDILYFCAPNNPTGVMPSLSQLKDLIEAAKKHSVVIILDTAYWPFIRNPEIPHSIYELDGAREVVIEVGSFSKMIGFTGVRSGWTVVPKEIQFADGTPLHSDWTKVVNVTHNGSSILSQKGALASLTDEGRCEVLRLTDYYLKGASRIKTCLEKMGISCVGGVDCPYVWAHFPGEESWDVFKRILAKSKVMTTPGSGFGEQGKEYVRFSGFCQEERLIEACKRLENIFSPV